MIKIGFAVIFFQFALNVYAANSCDLPTLQYTKEAYELVDRDYIDKMLRSPGYHKEIDEAIQNYSKMYGKYPELVDNKTGALSDRRLIGQAPDGKWLVIEKNGTATWLYNPLTKYSLNKKSIVKSSRAPFVEGQQVWSKEKKGYGQAVKIAYALDDGRYVVTNGRGLRVVKPEDLSATYIKSKTKGKVIQIQPAK